MRKRLSNNDLPEVERPSGALKENEIEEIRYAYADGCKGEILIGLCGEERVITMLLPARVDDGSAESFLQPITAKLKEMSCDRYIRIFNADQTNYGR